MIEAFDITNTSLTFLGEDGVPRSAERTHPNYDRLRDGLLDGASADDLILLVDTKSAIEGQTFGLVTVGNDAVWYKTQQLHGYLIEKLIAMLADGVIDISPWALLLDNLMLNPDPATRADLPLFLERARMPITRDGHFLAWRIVREDFTDVYSGRFDCSPGKVIEMDRNDCDPNRYQTCSSGLHAAAFDYLSDYGLGESGRKVMLVKINPRDVVAVPEDYDNAKLRACRIEILREVPAEQVEHLFTHQDHIVTEDGWIEDETYPVADWRYAVDVGDTKLGYDDWVEEQYEMATSSATWKTAVINGDTELSFQNWASQQ